MYIEIRSKAPDVTLGISPAVLIAINQLVRRMRCKL